jgi:hypothetical protein
MGVLDNAKEHFKSQLLEEPKKIEVAEWKTTIYYKPISLRTKAELNKYAGNPFEYAAKTLILRSLDEDGNKIFRSADFTSVMRECDPNIVEDIVYKMVTSDGDDEDLEKK